MNHLTIAIECLVGCIIIICGINLWKRLYKLWIHQLKLIKATQNFPGPSLTLTLKVIWEIVSNTKGIVIHKNDGTIKYFLLLFLPFKKK